MCQFFFTFDTKNNFFQSFKNEKKSDYFGRYKTSMNLDITLKWPMTRLCILNYSTDLDVVQLIPTIRYISAR